MKRLITVLLISFVAQNVCAQESDETAELLNYRCQSHLEQPPITYHSVNLYAVGPDLKPQKFVSLQRRDGQYFSLPNAGDSLDVDRFKTGQSPIGGRILDGCVIGRVDHLSCEHDGADRQERLAHLHTRIYVQPLPKAPSGEIKQAVACQYYAATLGKKYLEDAPGK